MYLVFHTGTQRKHAGFIEMATIWRSMTLQRPGFYAVMMLHRAERTASARISTVRMNRPNPRQHLFIYIFSRSPRPHRNLRFHALTLRRWEPMNDSAFETIGEAAAYLKLDLKAADVAALATRENWSEDHLQSVSDMFILNYSRCNS